MFCEHRNETDSRYDSQAESYEINLSTRYNPSRLSYDLELKHGWETGNNASAEFQYELEKIEFNQRVYWYWRRNSRIAGQLKYRYNLRNGDDYAVWLKDKRDGSVMVWNIGYNYKMNDYVRLEVEYKGDKYPQERETHEFRMEVSAEF
jgi:hypothetical protein